MLKNSISNWIRYKAIMLLALGLICSVRGNSQSLFGKGECDFKVSYQVEKSQAENEFQILLKIENGSGNAEVKIVDFKDASKGILDRKSISLQDYSQDFKPIFFDLDPSTYIVQIYVGNKCIVSVNGAEGIEIKGN